MGAFQSKKSKRKHKVGLGRGQKLMDFVGDNEEATTRMFSQSSYDETQIYKLRRELNDDAQIFVLNNLLMSIMFFENYDKERQRLMTSSRTPHQKEVNTNILLSEETIERILPDMIFEHVNKNIRFRPLHGPQKEKSEPLIPRRIYVVNDNIEVLESNYVPHYSAIDKPSYQVETEESSSENQDIKSSGNQKEQSIRSGFVKLRCVDKQPRQTQNIEKEETYNDIKSEPQPGPSTKHDDGEIYEYSTITAINTPKPLNVIKGARRDTLPESCFVTRQVKKLREVRDSDSDEESQFEDPSTNVQLYEKISYISSEGFMSYFKNVVFPNSLGIALGFDSTEIELAGNAIPGKIFCNLYDEDTDDAIPCEIVPSVAFEWPFSQAYEFHHRGERPKMWDKFGNEYQWPSDNMVKEIEGMKCVLVPKGFIQKRGENPEFPLEWEIGFPRAERYLDMRMNHAQMKTFLILLTIYKTYIQPKTKNHGLLIEHIRNFMYWECEANPKDWPEHMLGAKLRNVLKSFHDKLSVSQLPDFFIKKKNIFENVPNKYLKHAQKVFHDILEAPMIYMVGALRNLRYTSGKFYPSLDFKKLHQLLVSNSEEAMALVNADVFKPRPPNIYPKKRSVQMQISEGDKKYKSEIAWRIDKERVNREKVMKRRKEREEKETNLTLTRKGSIDSVDLEWQCEKKFDVIKCREILIFFIKHFIDVAKKSRKLGIQNQALLYLKQAYYLAHILDSYSGLQEDATELLAIITKEEVTCKKLSVQENFDVPPSTPARNSAQFNWDLTQQVKGNNINLNNLNMSYNNTAVKPPPGLVKANMKNIKGRNSMIRNNEDRRRSIDMTGRKSVGFAETVELR